MIIFLNYLKLKSFLIKIYLNLLKYKLFFYREELKLLINKATGSGERVEIDLLNSGDGNSSFFKEELLPAGEVSK